MNISLPDAPNMEHLKTQAKRLLAAVHAKDPAALRRFASVFPGHGEPFKLAAAQLVIAREYGFASWQKLKRHVATLQGAAEVTNPTRKFRQIIAELHLADVAAAATFFEEELGFKRGYTLAYPDGRLDFAIMINDPVEIYLLGPEGYRLIFHQFF